MNKLWQYLKTKDFRNNFLGAIGVVIGVVLIVFFSLSFYTRHGSAIQVPQLTGMTMEKAVAILQEQGFDYKIDSVYVLDKPPGTITEQDPDAGTSVKEGRVIYLTMVTRLAPNVTLPDLTDATYHQAVADLSNYGLKVGDTTYRSDIAKDRVLEVRFSGQIVKTGDKIPKGSVLDLVLGDGEGAGEVDIPELISKDLDEAKFAIKGAGLAIGTISYQGPITDSANLVVVQQYPAKSDSVSKAPRGARINMTVVQGKKTDDLH